MKKACVTERNLVIPTYGTGKRQRLPMFFEKRVYQGSSGRVYPYAVTEKICDVKEERTYKAVVLENDWLEVVVLPEIGGRIYTAKDKTNGYDFVYRNNVIKPALVGLLGPWISGGIEFNWPQHHRPTTFMPVNYRTEECGDGVCVYVGEIEGMTGLRQSTRIKLFDDNARIEISTTVYNGEDTPRTFLWWANPAYSVNDDTVTVMPPDVNAVMDHGKRAVSTFPIATGEYYKMDYSAGVDISRYRNVPVPTSFMAYKSEFDFVGGYDYGRRAGLLHVADHLVSPGKKQWTWGCGDFGRAWDDNLTDNDGPYVELMTGCFTDNQPDFTFIEPHCAKKFTQYFMPYKQVGRVLNADENTRATLGVNSVACFSYVTSVYFPITMGMVNILFNCSMLISQFFVMNAAERRMQLINVLLQVPAMVLFGFMLDFWLYVTENFHPENMPYGYAVCFITFFVGSVIIALNIVLQAIGNVAKLPCDAFVMILAARINKKLGWVKLAFDAFLVITAAIMSLLCSGFTEIIGIREGTVLGALMIGPMVQVLMPYFAFFTRWIDKAKEQATQSA